MGDNKEPNDQCRPIDERLKDRECIYCSAGDAYLRLGLRPPTNPLKMTNEEFIHMISRNRDKQISTADSAKSGYGTSA